MHQLSDNYYIRKCLFERDQVPTQSVIKKAMAPPLAAVFFKSMTPELKVLAGLAPPMKGGGSDWYQPPKDLLEGRAVLKPIKKEHLNKLSYEGIGWFGEKFLESVRQQRKETKKKLLAENDANWKKKIEETCRNEWEECSSAAAKPNTTAILKAFEEFSILYRTSLDKLDEILINAATQRVQLMKEKAHQKMKEHFEILVKQQATMLSQRYGDKLSKEKEKLKSKFILEIEESRTEMSNQIHDINIERRVAIEKLRKLLESQNLACQVYIALKEREECAKETRLSQHEHNKKLKMLKEQIALKDIELRLEQEKERKRQEFIRIWKKKVCQVVKKFQIFVKFCLQTLPEYADFFIDMEKLMLLQLSEAVEVPTAESIVEVEHETAHTLIPKPHPFYLICDKGYKPNLNQNLCPEHCTSSASQMPVIVVNKRCIYAACDNFDVFTDKVSQFVHGRRGDSADFSDDHEYEYDVPVKFTSSQQLLELKLESSLLQVLQNELPIDTQVPIQMPKCTYCKIPFCFCDPLRRPSKMYLNVDVETNKGPSLKSVSSCKIKFLDRHAELEHEREPKWESYIQYIHPQCNVQLCTKLVKKHLEEHLPPYMRNMSRFDKPDIPNYEMCDVAALKRLVKAAQVKSTKLPVSKSVSKTREISTQYSDEEVDFLCNCFSDNEVDRIFDMLANKVPLEDSKEHFKVVGDDLSQSHLESTGSFANRRVLSLRALLDDAPELQEIFMKKDCMLNNNN